MGSLQVECPLCCCKSFDSKESLLNHLVHITDKLNCPLCNTKCDSLHSIITHLNESNCQIVQTNSVENIVFYEDGSIDDNSADNKNVNRIVDELNTEYITNQTYECQGDTGDANKMYEFILKPHDLKLMKEEGDSSYVIVNPEVGVSNEMSTIVTKQNSDGTVSLTNSKDIKEESDSLIVLEPEITDSHGEIYTCNACKVSFTSVYEHIQTYHNDQEVILEDIASEIEPEDSHITMDSDGQETDQTEKQPARRVITDTGDIVEEPVITKNENAEEGQSIDKNHKKSKVVLNKQGRNRRLLQIKKTDKTIADKNVAKNTTKDGTGTINPYHKVVSKEVQTEDGLTVSVYHCLLCNVNVNTPNEFENYTCTVNGSIEPTVNFECEVCSTVFQTNKSLKLHKRMHDPVKARPIEPPVENNDGTDLTGSVYRCNICDKVIPFDYRKIHENSHKVGDKLNCSICNKKFTSMKYLEMHMNVHNVDKVAVNKTDKSLPYECVYCNRRFARPHEKVKHERIHTGEKPHACEICGKSFRVSYCLTLHMRTHTGARPYACQHCGKRFKAHSVYNHHLLTHSEVRAYKCPFCPKAFKTSVQLAGHKNSHTKPFSCQQCNRPFASLYAVRLHTETHARQNNLKFSCTLCGASYAREFALKDHVKQAHGDKQEAEGEPEEINNYVTDDWNV